MNEFPARCPSTMDARPGPAVGSLRTRQKPAGSEPHNPSSAMTSVSSSARAPANSTRIVNPRQQPSPDLATSTHNPSHTSPSPNIGGISKQDDKASSSKGNRSDINKVTKTSSSSLKRAATVNDVTSNQRSSKDELKSKNAKSDLATLVSKSTEVCTDLTSKTRSSVLNI